MSDRLRYFTTWVTATESRYRMAQTILWCAVAFSMLCVLLVGLHL